MVLHGQIPLFGGEQHSTNECVLHDATIATLISSVAILAISLSSISCYLPTTINAANHAKAYECLGAYNFAKTQ